MAEDSLVGDMREEARLRCELVEQVRYVFLPFRRERLLVSCPTAEGHNDDFALFRGCFAVQEWTCAHGRGAHCETCGSAQKVPPAGANSEGDLPRTHARKAAA